MAAHNGVARVFGENLAIARHRVHLSQEALGRLAGLHRTEIGMLEHGERTPRIDTLVKLSGSVEAPRTICSIGSPGCPSGRDAVSS
jgi:transcriptional regulator with XRE-family HTH domain